MSHGTYTRRYSARITGCPCAVPFCSRSTSRGDDGHIIWFCARHWSMVPPRWKAAWKKCPANRDDLWHKLTARLIGFCVDGSLSDSKVSFQWSVKT